MFCRSKTTRSLLLLSALTAVLGTAPAQPVHAAAYTYNVRQRAVHAGVLTFAGVADPAPYVFYVLDQRADIKPVGWTFDNPIAPGTITPTIQNRWPAYPGVGQPLISNMAGYWEVPLRETSSDQLQQFDVLYLPATGLNFTPSDNEKLRRFVDGGGQLIVEYTNTAGTLPLFAGTGWQGGSGPSFQAPGPVGGPFDLEPILTQPNFFQPADLTTLSDTNPTGLSGTIVAPTGDFDNLFSTVLYLKTGTNPVVAAAQLGAGQIVASTLSLGPVVSVTSNANFSTTTAPNNPLTAPAIDLKMLSNMLSWEDAHPTENKTSHQNSAGPSSASFAPAWSYPDPSKPALNGPTAPGAAVWGNLLYVTDSTGVLHCFDAFPDKDLLGEGKSDNGSIVDFSTGTSCDEIWKATVGQSASGPTIATFRGSTSVFVEKADGSILQFNSITGTQINSFPTKSTVTYPAALIPYAPAPTFYAGRLYAGQADGTLLVHDVVNGSGSAFGGVNIPLQPLAGSPGEAVTASPAVGVLAAGTDSNAIAATVATNQRVYTVLLGGRNDPLVAYSANGQQLGYNVSRGARYRLPNLFVDTASVPAGFAFDSGGGSQIPIANGQDPVFASALFGDYFANWDTDFTKSLSGGNATLTLHQIKDLSLKTDPTVFADTVSPPAFARSGDYYFTVNGGGYSYLMGVHDDVQTNKVRIKFRFRMPVPTDTTNYPTQSVGGWLFHDADNVDYTNFANGGYAFVGAPVIDGQGNVYVAAQNSAGNLAVVFCFNGNQAPTADAVPGFDTTQASYSQNDEGANGTDNSLNSGGTNNPAAVASAQLLGGGNHLTAVNFGQLGSPISGNLTEPQPFYAAPNANQNPPQVGQPMQFHTNLAWYTQPFPVQGQISGLTKAGNTLMLVDSAGPAPAFNILYKLSATPTVGAAKLVKTPPIQVPLGSHLSSSGTGGFLNIGTVAAAPSAGGGAMIVNGTTGIAGFNQQLTLIADNNRILEADADGNAVWSADATTRVLGTGTATQVTKVDFGHPTALSQVAPNDYLVADTGNNRCVRFDRAGNVLWELTRFNDPQGLMAPGQPNTLSQPTSVEINAFPDPLPSVTYKDANNNPQTGSRKYYLVADSGNNRIVEVTDLVDASGQNILYKDASGNLFSTNPTGAYTSQDHILTWISHTADVSGRRYRYAGATYFSPSAGLTWIAALVTNTRLGGLAANGSLVPASADSPGGSMVVFNRPPLPVAFNTITPTTPSDIIFVFNTFSVAAGSNAGTYQVRNPRFLRVYTAPQPAPAPYTFLYADDNGAFDLTVTGNVLVAKGLAFTAKDYQAMSPASPATGIPTTTVPSGANPVPLRTYFVPTCVQRINNDNSLQPRYLITQSFGQAELGTALPGAAPPPKIGGEIFEVDVDQTPLNFPAGLPVSTVVGGFGPGATLSRPGGTSPLTQPTYAIRTPQ